MSAAPVSYYDATLALINSRVSNAEVTRKDIAAGMRISQKLLGRKLSGDSMLTVQDIGKLARVLGCRMSELVA